jgi:hypothetical protein
MSFRVGDKVVYKGEKTVIVAKCHAVNYFHYIVEYKDGWSGSANSEIIIEGQLKKNKKISLCC